MQSANKETLQERSEKLCKAFEKAEKQLGDGPFFNGAVMGNVDVAWLPLLHRAGIVEQHSGYDFLEAFPKVRAWQRSILKTGIAEKSVPEDFEEAFSKFYLDERTFLGRGANFDEQSSLVAAARGRGGCCG